jgi:hypothetical protein
MAWYWKYPPTTNWSHFTVSLVRACIRLRNIKKGLASRMIARGRCFVLRSARREIRSGAVSRTDVWYMVRRRVSSAGIETGIGCYRQYPLWAFRGT